MNAVGCVGHGAQHVMHSVGAVQMREGKKRNEARGAQHRLSRLPHTLWAAVQST